MAKKKMKWLINALKVVASIGAVNLGLVGLFNYNLIETILGTMPMLVKVVYIGAGIGGAIALYDTFKD